MWTFKKLLFQDVVADRDNSLSYQWKYTSTPLASVLPSHSNIDKQKTLKIKAPPRFNKTLHYTYKMQNWKCDVQIQSSLYALIHFKYQKINPVDAEESKIFYNYRAACV